ncbi:hypothetical protein T439DRAFT_383684 [Meredithblackwellia eburnea MCA 4105]
MAPGHHDFQVVSEGTVKAMYASFLATINEKRLGFLLFQNAKCYVTVTVEKSRNTLAKVTVTDLNNTFDHLTPDQTHGTPFVFNDPKTGLKLRAVLTTAPHPDGHSCLQWLAELRSDQRNRSLCKFTFQVEGNQRKEPKWSTIIPTNNRPTQGRQPSFEKIKRSLSQRKDDNARFARQLRITLREIVNHWIKINIGEEASSQHIWFINDVDNIKLVSPAESGGLASVRLIGPFKSSKVSWIPESPSTSDIITISQPQTEAKYETFRLSRDSEFDEVYLSKAHSFLLTSEGYCETLKELFPFRFRIFACQHPLVHWLQQDFFDVYRSWLAEIADWPGTREGYRSFSPLRPENFRFYIEFGGGESSNSIIRWNVYITDTNNVIGLANQLASIKFLNSTKLLSQLMEKHRFQCVRESDPETDLMAKEDWYASQYCPDKESHHWWKIVLPETVWNRLEALNKDGTYASRHESKPPIWITINGLEEAYKRIYRNMELAHHSSVHELSGDSPANHFVNQGGHTFAHELEGDRPPQLVELEGDIPQRFELQGSTPHPIASQCHELPSTAPPYPHGLCELPGSSVFSPLTRQFSDLRRGLSVAKFTVLPKTSTYS